MFFTLAFAASALLSPYALASSLEACAGGLNGRLPDQTPIDFNFSGNVRRYYIAAEEIIWDYAPSGWDNWLGLPVNLSPRAQAAGYTKYGTKWNKAVYRGYTDAGFTEKSPQPEWQGIQGPTIRSEVGDLIEILFSNKLTSNFASIHSMGLAYSKENEGALYPNATSLDPQFAPSRGDAVPPGGCAVYKWVVPESSAPSPTEPSNMHGYHSYVSEAEDVFAGLIGPQMTYHRGKMNETISKYREFPILFLGIDESSSFLSGVNSAMLKNVTGNYSIPSDLFKYGNQSHWLPQVVNLLDSQNFDDAPTFEVVNGWVYSNNPAFKMCQNDNVIWYVYGK